MALPFQIPKMDFLPPEVKRSKVVPTLVTSKGSLLKISDHPHDHDHDHGHTTEPRAQGRQADRLAGRQTDSLRIRR